MGDYPMGGMVVGNNDVSRVDLWDTQYDDNIYVPSGANNLDLEGLMLARNVAGTKLVPYVAAQHGTDSTGEPIAVLGANVQADGSPSDVNLRAIVDGHVREVKLHTILAPTVAITIDDKDRLRRYGGIVALSSTELSKLDNQ